MKVTQLCLSLCDPMDYIVHGILQAKILQWVAFPFSQGVFPTQDSNPGLPHGRQILYQLSHKGSPRILQWVAIPSPADVPDPGIEPGSPALRADSLPTELSPKGFKWHHRLSGHESEQTSGDNDRQGSLVCCSSRGCKEFDMT